MLGGQVSRYDRGRGLLGWGRGLCDFMVFEVGCGRWDAVTVALGESGGGSVRKKR